MPYHPNDADERLAEQERERQERERGEHLAALPIEERIAWLNAAGARVAEAMRRTRERIAAQRAARAAQRDEEKR